MQIPRRRGSWEKKRPFQGALGFRSKCGFFFRQMRNYSVGEILIDVDARELSAHHGENVEADRAQLNISAGAPRSESLTNCYRLRSLLMFPEYRDPPAATRRFFTFAVIRP
jgi:hypothetical protein